MSGSYGGKIDFESVLEYEKSGTYEPATKEHPAKNVPKPKKPAGADEKSLKGLHLSIAFAVAATQYAYNTGDYSLLEQSSMSEPERNYFLREEKERLDKTREGTYWPDNVTIDYTLTQESPRLEGDGKYARFFSQPVRLGKEGVEEILPIGTLSKFEQEALEAMLPTLRADIELGEKFING